MLLVLDSICNGGVFSVKPYSSSVTKTLIHCLTCFSYNYHKCSHDRCFGEKYVTNTFRINKTTGSFL